MKKVVLSSLAAFTLGSVAANATPNPELVSKSVSEATGIKHDILERIHFKGDLRLRLISAIDLTDTLTFDAGMRSGFGNPTSWNQTFEDEPLSDYFLESLRFNVLHIKTEILH